MLPIVQLRISQLQSRTIEEKEKICSRLVEELLYYCKYRSDIDHSSVKPGHVSNASDVRLMRRVCTIEVDENSIIGEKIIIRTT